MSQAAASGAAKPKKQKQIEVVDDNIDDLKEYRLELYQQIVDQKKALKLLEKDKYEKVDEMNVYANKRQDFQREMRNKTKIFEKKDQAKDRMNKQIEVEMQMALQQHLDKEDAFKSQKKGKNKYMDMPTQEKFETLQKDSQEQLERSVEDIRQTALKALKHFLQRKLTDIKEKPSQILKRIDQHVPKVRPDDLLYEATARAVEVKIMEKCLIRCKEMAKLDEQIEEQQNNDELENGTVNQESHKSQNTERSVLETGGNQSQAGDAVSNKSGFMNKMKDKMMADDKGLNLEEYKMFSYSFRISRITEIPFLKKYACEFWNLEDCEKDLAIYDLNGDPVEPTQFDPYYDPIVERQIQAFQAKEPRWKELVVEGDQKATFFIGRKDSFRTNYETIQQYHVDQINEKKDQKKEQEQDGGEEGEEPEEDEGDDDKDAQEVFLQQFPYLSVFYKNNKRLIKKYERVETFSINSGGWVPPSFCSILINIAQFQLTLQSIFSNKGNPAMFWHPAYIRESLETPFLALKSQDALWNFIEKDVGKYLFRQEDLTFENGTLNLQMLQNYSIEEYSQPAGGRLIIGPMRILQKRVKSKPCVRRDVITVEKYQKYFKECYEEYYNEETQYQEDLPLNVTNMPWGKYRKDYRKFRPVTGSNEFYVGHFGSYDPGSGYYMDFFPYDETYKEFIWEIEEMRKSFIEPGATKSIDIDFSLCFPDTGYFVGVNILIELSSSGQIIPTRMDILPYRMSAFSPYCEDINKYIDTLKVMLVVYTIQCVVGNFMKSKTCERACSFVNMSENAIDIMVIFLQSYCACIKLQDGFSFDIDPENILKKDVRSKYHSIYMYCVNFRSFSIMESLGLVFVFLKQVEALRLFEKFNVIVLTIEQSLKLIFVFLVTLISFNLTLTPLANAIWGTYLIGYKTYVDASNSVFMIAYSKGNVDQLLDINVIWSAFFIIIYYMVAIFIMHAMFHNCQTDALKNVVLLFSLDRTDVVEEEEKKVNVDDMTENEKRKYEHDIQRKGIEQVTRSLKWLFNGWTSRGFIQLVGRLPELQPELELEEEDDEDDDDYDDEDDDEA